MLLNDQNPCNIWDGNSRLRRLSITVMSSYFRRRDDKISCKKQRAPFPVHGRYLLGKAKQIARHGVSDSKENFLMMIYNHKIESSFVSNQLDGQLIARLVSSFQCRDASGSGFMGI